MEKLIQSPGSPQEIIGFHAQQSVEKCIKAVLAFSGIDYPRIHDLTELINILLENKIAFPNSLYESDNLTPFATVFRYYDLPAEPSQPFDPAWALDCVRQVRAWAESLMRKGGSE